MTKYDGKNENDELMEEQDSVIQEQIKPWHKRKFKKILSVIGFSLLAGIIFGIAARFVFKYSDSVISRIFGLNEPFDEPNQRNPVIINSEQTNQGNDKSNDIKITSVPDDNPNKNEPQKQETENTSISETDRTTDDVYMASVEKMRRTADAIRKSLVNISAVTNVVNWLGENIEQTEATMGMIVTESPMDIYIITYYDKVQNADRLEVKFDSGNTYIVPMTAYDDGYNIAIMTLSKSALKQNDLESLSILKMGNSDDMYSGMPVIGVGSFDGQNQLTEYGYITSDSHTEYITDASIGMFTTDLSFSGEGEGVITDIDGKLIGVITRRLGSSLKFNINKCIKINSLIKVAEKLCNGVNRIYFGIVAENIPNWALRENNIESGIYVNGVEPSSPAADAGIRRGDFIVSVDGKEIGDVDDFSEILLQASENSIMNIELYRSSKSADQRFFVTVIPVNRNN